MKYTANDYPSHEYCTNLESAGIAIWKTESLCSTLQNILNALDIQQDKMEVLWTNQMN